MEFGLTIGGLPTPVAGLCDRREEGCKDDEGDAERDETSLHDFSFVDESTGCDLDEERLDVAARAPLELR